MEMTVISVTFSTALPPFPVYSAPVPQKYERAGEIRARTIGFFFDEALPESGELLLSVSAGPGYIQIPAMDLTQRLVRPRSTKAFCSSSSQP